MKRILITGLMFLLIFSGCTKKSENIIVLSDEMITLNGEEILNNGDVYISNDIIYYENKETYESGLPYGEGEDWEKHTSEEADEHTVLNITKSGSYRISGELSKGQVRIDLGEDAFENPNEKVELILDNADITCDVAPAILFVNVYECDNGWSTETAKAQVDTKNAGANIVLEKDSINNITGSHVAKIYKDKEGEKKLYKQDGAIYSYMSMNVDGEGVLNVKADNEGLDTELHLTINNGNINIEADNDGINTNEDGVSVTTINGGNIYINAGLGDEGDGIDSNGWLVINDGVVVSNAKPFADAGLDSDMGSFINGGTVVALGSTMDWPESDSKQITMNLQFKGNQQKGEPIIILDKNEKIVFAFTPDSDEVNNFYKGAIISTPNFEVGKEYSVYVGGEILGEKKNGIYDLSSINNYTLGKKQGYIGTELSKRPPMSFEGGEMPKMPEGDFTQMPDGERPQRPNREMPDFNNEKIPQMPDGERPPFEKDENFGKGERFPGFEEEIGELRDNFVMTDKVNSFTSVQSLQE